ncbi:MAG: glycosyltransferase [Arachidicoccus sp.]|nr:glycosyltransferase [Arachidicoccus sp.]
MKWLIVKQKESLSEYSYATYIYNMIADDFFYKGIPIIELIEEEKFDPVNETSDVLYVINAPDGNELQLKIWYSLTIPKILKRLQIEKAIYLNGMIGSYKLIRQPQIMLLFGTEYFVQPKHVSHWQQVSFKKIAKNVSHASMCFTYSSAAVDILSNILSEHIACHIRTLPPAPRSIFRMLTWEEKQEAKKKYASGCEYYLLKAGEKTIDEVVSYLKAFSYFKKWQNSSMKLVIMINNKIVQSEKFKTLFSTYYFRDDVLFIGEMQREDFHLLLGAAYAFLMLTGFDSDLLYIVEAIQCGTPVITLESPSLHEIAKDAPYYLLGTTSDNIAQSMMAMYKSERMRTTHIEKGLEIALHFNYEATKAQLMSWLHNV